MEYIRIITFFTSVMITLDIILCYIAWAGKYSTIEGVSSHTQRPPQQPVAEN